ncbi:MAG: FG-GAP-like repeat-containing protein [Gammaproteobacteria bacterium]|nr:FG-GAP-like repeat-containing protein [Gammaproteobacteria bacterium]
MKLASMTWWYTSRARVAAHCAMLGAAFAVAGAAGTAAAGPRLVDLHGAGTQAAVVRHADGTWRAYGGRDLATPVQLSMTRNKQWYWAASGDFDGNGTHDVLLRRTDGVWTYYPMGGGNVVDAGRGWSKLTRNPDWRPVGVGDFNDDGRDDVLLRRGNGGWAYYAMNGRRVIDEESGWANLPRRLDWRIAGVGDFDGDGRDDVLLRHVDGAWRLYPMEGRRIVRERVVNLGFEDDVAWRFVSVGDFDADGRDDVLLRHTSGRWRWQSSMGDAVASHHPPIPPDWRWRLAAVGDVDGDGGDDVLVRHVDGRWRSHSGLGGPSVARTPGMPADLAWRIGTPPVHIPDPALRRRLRAALALSAEAPITRRALSGLEALKANGAGVSDLSGLGLATGLRDLELRAVSSAHGTPKSVVDDITELASLVQLTRLSLSNHGLTDISPVSTLTRLEYLALSVNRIVDIGPLAALSRLSILWLVHNRIHDLAPLAGLDNLHALYLDDNDVADLAPLSGLSSLRTLYMHWNEIEDVAPLAALTDLTSLRLESNRITDISPLASLTKLGLLSVYRNRISDVSTLSELTALTFLGLGKNDIRDISALRKLTRLTYLSLGETAISDITPLSDMRELRRLELESNDIVDITPLAAFTKLVWLELDDNAIVEIGPLANLTALTDLRLAGNRIADIAALRDLRKVERLNLSGNEIVDIAALEFLTELEDLDLSYNRIADIAPLAANEGLGDGDSIDLRGNPLSDTSLTTNVRVLVDRGAQVETPVRWDHDYLHDDMVVILPIDKDVAAETVYTGLPLRDYAAEFYSHFQDEFDFLMFFSNLDDISEHDNPRYYGIYLRVRNDVEGAGLRKYYDNRFRSRERLKGVIHFPYNRALMYGPSLHEILHAWANFAVPTATGAHWGFSSANGQLGGFDLANLEELGEGRYAAGRFGTFANGGNGPPYSPIELYLAGFLPPEEVPDLWVAADGQWARGNDGASATTEAGSAIFEAEDVRTYTVDDIVERNGERVPTMGEAQRSFRAALVLLTDDDHPATPEQLDILSEHAAWFSQQGSDDRPGLHNFYEATQGRGSITFDGLAAVRRATAGAPADLPASYGTVPAAHASLIDGTCVIVDLARIGESMPVTIRLAAPGRGFVLEGEPGRP